jgi:hypothetical protein
VVGVVELDGVCVVSVLLLELGEDGIAFGSVVDGVWVEVLGLVVVDVLPDVCASIIMLNVNTSATINKAFFMLFSNSSKSMGPSEKLFRDALLRASPSAPSSAIVYDAGP